MQRSFAGSTANFRAWRETVAGTHQRRIRVHVLTPELNPVGNLTDLFQDGSVTIDVTNECSRTLDLTLVDRSRSIRFEPDSGDFPIYLNRVIRVWDDRFVPGVGWVECPVFTGPVVSMGRDGASVSLRCDGMERFALGDYGKGETWVRKVKTTNVIRDLLRAAGETRLAGIPDLGNTLGDKLTLERTDKPWSHAERLAREMNRVLVYDPMGHLHMRRPPGKPGLTLDDTTVGSNLRVNSSPKAFFNKVYVLGPKPEGDKDRIVGRASLPPKHKGSPRSLGRNGQPRFFIKEIDAKHVDNVKDANHRAAREIAGQATAEDSLSIDSLPFPHVEEWDLIAVRGEAGSGRLRIKQATLPLVDGLMSLGATRRSPLKGGGKGHGRLGGAGKVA